MRNTPSFLWGNTWWNINKPSFLRGIHLVENIKDPKSRSCYRVMGFKLLNFLTICIDDWVIRLIGASNRSHGQVVPDTRRSGGTTRERPGVQEQPGVIFRRHLRRDWSTLRDQWSSSTTDYYSLRVPSNSVYDTTWRLMSLLVIYVITTGLVLQ